ncbi:Na/Pi cotransporter family protein [Alicyclobacillus sp. SO9]|uniref:Na/Pi cotransporter family protein n=1 Tax=Alicyclobacillus sp. SO9 TaxID=2665646 RepID=UPI0018E762E9|nr:Na/Pi symporter [Alicyclobacillus sp. SO9]QQE77340.1 Na/Pi cotransporter family protein [Alicyclobacillus sp. SO9]
MFFGLLFAAASLGAFLAGLRVLRYGLEQLASGRLPQLLQSAVKTPTRGILTGLITTAAVQSSAAITAITVGMTAAGSMAFKDALGIVLGSNVGSTVTPQILTVNLWSLVFPAFGLGLVGLISRKPRFFHPSLVLLGFSVIFISLHTLSSALQPLSRSPWFATMLQSAGSNALIAILAGCIASAAIQSSTATTVVTMALAVDGLIPLYGGIAIVLGANIGTCFTSVIAALGQSRAAQQVALSHVLLNVGGAVLFLPIMGPFGHLNQWLSGNPAQQIANAHTIYNIVCTLLVWPVVGPFGRLVQRLLPDHRYA